MFSRLFTLCVVGLAVLVGLTDAALAQETVVTMDNLLAPWLPTITAICLPILVALGGWVSAWIKRKTGIEIEFFHRDAFQTAVDNAAGFILRQAGNQKIDMRHPLLREGLLMVNEGAKDAIQFFGVTEDAIVRRILGKMGLAEYHGGNAPAEETSRLRDS